MARWFLILILGCLAQNLCGTGSAQAQPSRAPSITFRNDSKVGVIVQGSTEVNGMQRRGQPLTIQAGKTNYDSNLPKGVRFITIYDANQPTRILLRAQVPVGKADLQFSIRPNPTNPALVVIVADVKP